MFIWFQSFANASVAVYIRYGYEPDIETLSFRTKIVLPTTSFDHEFSATTCIDAENCIGDQFGIRIDAVFYLDIFSVHDTGQRLTSII